MTLNLAAVTPGILTLVAGTQGALSVGTPAGAISVFNVQNSLYGALGNGVHDDTSNIQACIAACIAAGGGIVYFPAGTYKVTSTLDLGGMAGLYKGITLLGSGAGMYDSGHSSATLINYSGTGHVFSAIATKTGSTYNPISGLNIQNLGIKFTASLGASKYAIYWEGVIGGSSIQDIQIYGSGTGSTAGGGVAILDAYNGQITVDRVQAWNCYRGFRVTAEPTTIFTSGENSGNLTLNACMAYACALPWEVGSSGGNLIDGVTLNSCKAVAAAASTNSPGFHLDTVSGAVLNACHAEGHYSGIKIENSVCVTLNSPLVTNGSAPGPANSKAIELSAAYACSIVSADVWDMVYGVHLSGGSQGNLVLTRTQGSPNAVTTMFSDALSPSRNLLWAMYDSYPQIPLLQKAGAVGDADFAQAPANGTMGLDTTNHRLYVRDGGAWKYAALT